MPRLDINHALDEEFEVLEGRPGHFKPRKKRSQHALLNEKLVKTSVQDLGADEVFNPTLGSSRHEREWIFTYLGPFYNYQYITDVLRRIKGGKEANVYVCKAHPSMQMDYLAAKLYRPRMMRNLRNDARYRQNRNVLDEYGKVIHDGRVLHAVMKGTSYGKEISHTSWLQHEYSILQTLYEAGLPVPKPVACANNTILMDYVGGLDLPAPTLVETSLSSTEARRTFDILIDAVERMLSHNCIHADLSAYNVLFWEGQPTIIDFPQAVDPFGNPEAWDIFRRDVVRICQYFTRYGIKNQPVELASAMWEKHGPHPQPIDLEEEQEEEME